MLSHHEQRRARLDDARNVLLNIPLFRDGRLEDVKLEPLGSLTNTSYKVVAPGGWCYALRLPGRDTSDYIDRAAEEHNSRIAAAVGINAEVIFCNAEDGTMLSSFVEGVPMDGEGFGRDPEAPARAAWVLRRVHDLGRIFKSRFDVFSMIDDYLDILRKTGTPLPEDYAGVEECAGAVRRALEESPVPLVPCHNDPWPRNFIDTGERLYLIDWEFSGMNDPMWDLGDLSVEAGFGPDQDRAMMEAYCGGAVPPASYSRLVLYKAMSDLSWALWGFIQHANDNPAEDFLAYARGRFEHCKSLMGDAGFGGHLANVRASRGADASEPRSHASPRRGGPVRDASRGTANPRRGTNPAGSPPQPRTASA